MFSAPISSGVAWQSQLLRVALQNVSSSHLHQVRATILARQVELLTAATAASGDAVAPSPPSALNSIDGFLSLCQLYFISPLAAYRVAASTATNAFSDNMGNGVEHATELSEPLAVAYFMRMVERELLSPNLAAPHDRGTSLSTTEVAATPTVVANLEFPISADCAVLLVAVMAYYQSMPCPAGVDGVQLLRSVFDECVEKEEAQRHSDRRRHSDGANASLDHSMSFPCPPEEEPPHDRRVRWKTVLDHLAAFCTAHYHVPHRAQVHHPHGDDSGARTEVGASSVLHASSAANFHSSSLLQLLTTAVGLPQPPSLHSDSNDAESSPEWSPSVSPRSRRGPLDASSPVQALPTDAVRVTFDEFLMHLRDVSFADDRDRSRWRWRRRFVDATASNSSGSPNVGSVQQLPHCPTAVFDADPEYSEANASMRWLGDVTASFLPEEALGALGDVARRPNTMIPDSPSILLLPTPSAPFGSVAMESISCMSRLGLPQPTTLTQPDGLAAVPPMVGGSSGHQYPLASIPAQSAVAVAVDALNTAKTARRKSHAAGGNKPRTQSVAGTPHIVPPSPTHQLRTKIEHAASRVASVRTATDVNMQRTVSKAKHGLQVMEATTGDVRSASVAVLHRERLLNSRISAGASYAPSMTRREEEKLAEILGDYSASQELKQVEHNRAREARVARDKMRALHRRNLLREASRIEEETSNAHSLVAQENGLVRMIAEAHASDGRGSLKMHHAQARKAAHALSVLQDAKQRATLSDSSLCETTDRHAAHHRPLPTPTPGPGESPSRRRLPSPSPQMMVGPDTVPGSPASNAAPRQSGSYDLVVEADGVGAMRACIQDVYSFPDLLEALDDLLAPFQHQHRRSLRGGGKRGQVCSAMPHHSATAPQQRQRVSDVFVDASVGVGATRRFVPLGSIDELPPACKVRVVFGP